MDAMEGIGAVGEVISGGKKKKVKPGSFQGLGLSPSTYKAVMKMGYNMPTPIQRKTIPTILDGQDVVAMARTGSGKTAAFLIPVIERLQKHNVAVGMRAVALSPTRELAMQTAKFFRLLSKFTDLRCCLLVGGQAMEAQFEHLANNPDVVIATPGRLMHHILEADLSLSRVEVLVIDEADRLFELGFAEQLQKILDATPISRQCLLFSATLPAQLVSFSRVGLKDPAFVRLDVETTLSEDLDLWYLYARKDEKVAAAIAVLRFLAKPGKSTIMFVATRHHVEFFGELLNKVGITSAVVYGSMDQEQRTEMIGRFRTKKAAVLVTTDVAARGIDVPLLDYVLNYDFPPSGKLFVHRAGRTARAGRAGLAISLVTMDDLPYTVELMLFLGRKLRVADGSKEAEEAFAAGAKGVPLLGALPGLDYEVETLMALLEEEGTELKSFHKSMMASYHLYNKTRPSASKQSVARAKQLLEDCGGPARMQGLIHPAFQSLAGGKASAAASGAVQQPIGATGADFNFIQELRSFRPKSEKVGNVLSTSAMRSMELAKADAVTMKLARAEGEETMEFLDRSVSNAAQVVEAAEAEDAPAVETGTAKNRTPGLKRKLAKLSKPVASAGGVASKPTPVAAARPAKKGPRMSKRARQKLARGGGSTQADVAAEFADEFDISVDGTHMNGGGAQSGASKAAKGGGETEQFYLSVERDLTEEAKERGLEMEQYQMDLMPDDASDIKKAKSVIRWDAKKKKYLPVMVSVDGRVMKNGKKRNESGHRVKGDAEKSNIYKKWMQSTKKRIQKVGEMEQEYNKPVSKRDMQQQAAAAKRMVEFDDAGRSKTVAQDGQEVADGKKKKKPIVPFHGQIEDKYLTHKQRRLQQKRKAREAGGVTYGDAPRELRSAAQLQVEKKKKDQRQMKQKPFLRKQKSKEMKERRMQRMEEKQMKYGAHTRSKMLIFEGPRKQKKKRNRGFMTI